ncbi:MAG: hypothetical protein ACR2M1_15020 [Gemmatimonadaceae bacterium]
MPVEDNIKVGKPQVSTTLPSHTPGTLEGNSSKQQKGILPEQKSNASRSTGINAKARNPILPSMPNLSPA